MFEYNERRYDPIAKNWVLTYSVVNSYKFKELFAKYSFTYSNIAVEEQLKESNVNTYIEKRSRLPLIKQYSKYIEDIYANTQIRLRDYQLTGFNYMCSWPCMINGDDMGLGKTYQTIFSAEMMLRFPCLLVCPSNVKYQWRDYWQKVNPERTVSIIDAGKKNLNWDADVIIINYDLLGNKEVFTNKDGEQCWKAQGRYSELKTIQWEYAVFDEIHKLKNYKSLRSKAAQLLVKDIPCRHGLTGTLIENMPVELVNPLMLINMFTQVFGNWDTFINRYCAAEETRYGMNIKGASNTIELNRLLRATCYLRREKRDVVKELPPIQSTVYDITLSNLKMYLKAEVEFIRYLEDNFTQAVVDSAKMAEFLVQRNALRQLSLKGKVKGIIDWIEDYIENTTEKILVVGNYREPMQLLSIHFDAELIDGSCDAYTKYNMVQRWKQNKKQFLFGNVAAIGTGTDGLQDECSTLIVVDLPDKPSTLDQLISRIERIGVSSERSINVYYLLSKETIDTQLWEAIELKRTVTEAVNKGMEFKQVNINEIIIQSYLKR